jgi:hypothetical protein
MTKEQQEAVDRLHMKLAQSSPKHLFSPSREDVRTLLDLLDFFVTTHPEAEAVEPVAWISDHWLAMLRRNRAHMRAFVQAGHDATHDTPLYTHPPTIQADLDRAVEALKAAADQFRYYAESHAAKGTPDGDAKAKTNLEWAGRLTLATITKGQKP